MKRVKELCQDQNVLDRLLVIRALTVETLLEAAGYIDEQLDCTKVNFPKKKCSLKLKGEDSIDCG